MVKCCGSAQQFDHLQASPLDRSCFFNHIIIIMEIDDDDVAKLPNNQPHFGRLWSTSVRMVDEVSGLNGWE
jgi:hypothetical protein